MPALKNGQDGSPAPPGTRMSYWIARTLERERTTAGIHERRMAELMGVDTRTIKRWEAGDTFGRRSELDRAIAGYAYVLGLEDGRELWQSAINWWRAEGSPPEFMPEAGPAAAFAAAIRDEALRARGRQRQPRHETASGEKSSGPSASRGKRQAG